MRGRYVYDGGVDTGQELVEAVALVTGQENVGEVLGILRLVGATSKEIPGALRELAGFSEIFELEDAYVRFAEVWDPEA
jgi:hypothetical protein